MALLGGVPINYTDPTTKATPSAGAGVSLTSSYDGAADRAATRSQNFDTSQYVSNLGAQYNAGLQGNQGNITSLQLANNLAGASLQNYGQQLQDNIGYDQNTYNNNVASNNLNAIGNLSQQAAIPRQIDYTNNSYANQVARFNDQEGYLGQQRGFNDTDLSQTQGYLGQSGTLADQLQGIQNQGAGITQSDALRNARYATEASGGGATTRAYGENVNSANSTFQNALAGNANTNQSTHNSLGYQLGQAQLGHDKTSADLTDQDSSLRHGIFQSAMDTNEKNAQSNDQLGQLKLAGAQLGINATQLKDGLDHAINQLNLQGQLNASQILTGIGSNNAQIAQISSNALYAAMAAIQAKG